MKLLTDLLSVRLPRYAVPARSVLQAMLHHRPVWRIGDTALVLGAEEARDALARDRELRFGASNAAKMKLGPFILGMDDSPAYQEQKRALHEALRSQRERLPALMAELSDGVASTLPDGGRIDLLPSYVDPIVTRFTKEFYGVPLECGDGAPIRSRVLAAEPGEGVLCEWMRVLGALIITGSPAPFGFEPLAIEVAEELRDHLTAVAKDGRAPSGSVIDVTLARGLIAPDDIAAAVGGLMLAGRTVGRAFLFALHQLLQRPEELAAAVSAAEAGDDATLLAHVREALRFQPPFLFLTRYAARPTAIGSATPHEVQVPAGGKAMISPVAAMLDPERVPQPDEFDATRARDCYLHFAAGRHACLGDWVADTALTAMARALLRRPAFQHATPGRFGYRGPLISRYRMKLDA